MPPLHKSSNPFPIGRIRVRPKINFSTRIAPAKHSQRRDGRFIFPSSSLIFRERVGEKVALLFVNCVDGLRKSIIFRTFIIYVFHCRNFRTCSFFPLALLQYVRGILVRGRKNRSVLIAFYRIKKCASQQKLLNVKVLSLR